MSENCVDHWGKDEGKRNGKTQNGFPCFSEEEIKQQKERGRALMQKIAECAADLSQTEMTIEPGDYGFDFDRTYPFCVTDVAFCLHDIQRPDENPFTINAEGVTFWVQPTGRPFCYTSIAFLIYNCSNLRFVGLTLDEYVANDVEGVITDIDSEHNRIAVRLTEGSLQPDGEEGAKRVANGDQCRIIPFKENGNYIPSLYKIDPNSWGVANMWVDEIHFDAGKYWLYFRTDVLIHTVGSKEWQDTYGDRGTLRVGDRIAVVYGNINIELQNSKQIQMIEFTNHLSKCMPYESGGYGAHLWKDCYFGPRKNTVKILNGCEGMYCATRHGTTLDHVTVVSSSDDQINIHGFWCKIAEIQGNLAKLKNVTEGVLRGDCAIFYQPDGTEVFRARVAEDVVGGSWYETRDVVFDCEIPEEYKGYWVRFPDMECNGWSVKNCTFINNYQSFLIQSGSGVFENNRVYNLGEAFSVINSLGDYVYVEGGQLGDIQFRNNVFFNSSNCPGAIMFKFIQNVQWERKLMGGHMEIADNLFVRCGMLLRGKNIQSIEVCNNTVIEPLTFQNDVRTFGDLYGEMTDVDRFESSGNRLYSTKCADGVDGNDRNIALSEECVREIEQYLDTTQDSLSTVIRNIQKKIQ